MNKIAQLSVFFPFWNEEKNIEKVVLEAVSVVKKYAKDWEIIIVDDGSSDNTLALANTLAKKDERIRVVSHQPNRGYGAGLKEGFKVARYEKVVFTDGDGQFDFSQLPRFIEKIPHADMVIGYRKQRHDHPFRHFLMILLKIWDFIFFGFYFRDIDCGFKMFTRKAIEKILPLSSEGAMVTTELLAKARRAKLQILEVEVSHSPRLYGNQSGGNLRVVLRAIRETFVVWKNLHYGKS